MDVILRAITNWRTSLPAVILLILLTLYLRGTITEAQALTCVTITAAAGFFRAKDDKVTGGSEENHSDPDKKIR